MEKSKHPARQSNVTKVCDVCGKKFVPYKSTDRYCDDKDCKRKSKNARARGKTGVSTIGEDTPFSKASRLRKLDALLIAQGIDLDDLQDANIKAIKFWESAVAKETRDADGKLLARVPEVVELSGIEISPAWEAGPQWPVVQPAAAPKSVPPSVKVAPLLKGWETAVLLPDMQGGFWRDPETEELVETHDPRAIDIARQVVRAVNPKRIVMHGDNWDLPEFSKYRKHPVFAQTTQATVNWGFQTMQDLRSDAPGADMDWLEGNHEFRLSAFIIDNAAAAFGLKQANGDWPVMSVPHLCHLDELRINYISGYPANDVWLNDNFRIFHGHKVNSRGATASRYLEEERVSVAYGHIHRRELLEKTRHTAKGARTVVAVSFGCLCRIDGAVPSMKGGNDLFGRPLVHAEDWQQGLGIVHYQPRDDGKFAVEPIAIWEGWAMHRGQEFRSTLAGPKVPNKPVRLEAGDWE